MQPRRPQWRKQMVGLAAALALVVAACGSSNGTVADDPTVGDHAVSGAEVTRGPASQVLALQTLLPTSDDLDPRWQEWPPRVVDIPAACGMADPAASAKVTFVLIDDVSVIGHEFRLGINYYETEAEAEADLAWLNGELADECDKLLALENAKFIEEGSSGAYRVDLDNPVVGQPLAAPAELDDFSADGRKFDFVYTGDNDSLTVSALVIQVQVGQYSAWLEWAGPAESEVQPELVAVLRSVAEQLEDVGPIVAVSSTDELGERARASAIDDLIPTRFEEFSAASVLPAEPIGTCSSPDPTTALFEYQGQGWVSRQGRSGEYVDSSVTAFGSVADAEFYLDAMKTDGLACLADAPIWEDPVFVGHAVDQWTETRTVDGQDVELLFMRSSARQAVADLEVEVEFTLAMLLSGQMFFEVEYSGLLGDGDFIGDILVEMYERDRS